MNCSKSECEVLEERIVMPDPDSAVLVRKRVQPPGPAGPQRKAATAAAGELQLTDHGGSAAGGAGVRCTVAGGTVVAIGAALFIAPRAQTLGCSPA